jgi:hypothetical protein
VQKKPRKGGLLRAQTLAVLCANQEPSDVESAGTGKVKLHNACKAYKAKVFIQAQMFLITNNTEVIIPPLSLEYDCCVPEFEGKTVKLNVIQLDLSTKNINKL